jgi:hypothetical protein
MGIEFTWPLANNSGRSHTVTQTTGTTNTEAGTADDTTSSQTGLLIAAIVVGLAFAFAGYETASNMWQALKHSVGALIWLYVSGVLLQLTLLLNGLRHRKFSFLKDVPGVVLSYLSIGVLAWQGAKKIGVPRHYRRVRDVVGARRNNA